MSKEEKEILLVDLCARLPYNIIMNGKITNNIGRDNIDFVLEPALLAAAIACGCKPYLRPMSSMTDGEKHIFDTMTRGYTIHQQATLFDWLNANQFDYRGLIPKELAIEAPEGMYKIN